MHRIAVFTYLILSISGVLAQTSENVTLISQLTFPGNVVRVYVSEQLAYVTSTDKALRIIDISDPVQPQVISTYYTTGFARGIFVIDTLAYLVDGESFQVLSVSNPYMPFKIAELNILGQPWDLTISGNNAFVIDAYGNPGLNIVDITNPILPEKIGFVSLAGSAWTIAISGDYAYVANFLVGLKIIDIADPAIPEVIGTYDTDCYAYGVTISEDIVYLGDANCGLQVIDVSNPTSPILLSSVSTAGMAWHTAVSGELLYVASGTNSGLRIYNVSKPVFPTLVGYYDTQGSAYGVYVANNYIYVADLMGGFLILQYTASTNAQDSINREYNFYLSQNHPNPFNPETVIEYMLPIRSDVNLIIYNLRGQEVALLIDGNMPAGNHRVSWDASSLASGVYLYRLVAGDFIQIKKMVLLK